jgi:hypothetical protein
VSNKIVTNGNKTTSYTNSASNKTKAELAAAAKKLNSNKNETDKSAASNAFEDMDSEFTSKKKEKEKFNKMNKTDFSKMTEEQLLELHRRQRDLGSTSATKIYKKGGFVKRPSKKKEEYYEKYSDQGIENELDTPSEMLKEIRNKESKDIKNKVISRMPIYEIVPPPRKKEISASINLKKGGAVRKKSIMLKGRGGSFKGVK